MKCVEFRDDLSLYADRALDAERAREVKGHITECAGCARRYRELTQVQQLVRGAGRVPPPPELALAIRIRLSHRTTKFSLWETIRFRLQNLMEPIAVPAVAGLCAALFMFGILIHSLAIPTPAITDDIPLGVNKPPRLRMMAPVPSIADSIAAEQGVLLQVDVDHAGRIVDFRVLNEPQDPAVIHQLRRALLFTRWEPATYFGVPRSGSTVLKYSSISVKG